MNTESIGNSDAILSDVLDAFGPWAKHIIIGGGYAPIIYKLYFDDSGTTNVPLATQDIDSLISRRISKISNIDIHRHLTDAGFQVDFKSTDNPAAEGYIKEISGSEIEIEFLTDNSTREKPIRNVKISGVVAQPLSYLTMSLDNYLEFTTTTKRSGRVVHPAAWIFHKGLTFKMRPQGSSKYYKDLYGIWYVASQLGSFSEMSVIKLTNLASIYPKWTKEFCKNLNTWSDSASPSEWAQLESQDNYGNLTKQRFKATIENLIEPFSQRLI